MNATLFDSPIPELWFCLSLVFGPYVGTCGSVEARVMSAADPDVT